MKVKSEYYKYLDGYRFIAAFLVIITHWLPSYFARYNLSKIGVDMFFVLSGFLITEILLKQKREFDTSGIYKIHKKCFSFYARRSLRIFPIYYLVIMLFVLLKSPIILNNISQFLFYLSNLVIIEKNAWIGMFSHLWSLAIEEQFYVFWPILILTVPLKYLIEVILLLIATSLLYILYS